MSSVELPLTFGLGTSTTVERLRITWPSGLTEQVAISGVDHLVTIIEGQGKPVQASPAPGGSQVPSSRRTRTTLRWRSV